MNVNENEDEEMGGRVGLLRSSTKVECKGNARNLHREGALLLAAVHVDKAVKYSRGQRWVRERDVRKM